jgi:hypothetical protein
MTRIVPLLIVSCFALGCGAEMQPPRAAPAKPPRAAPVMRKPSAPPEAQPSGKVDAPQPVVATASEHSYVIAVPAPTKPEPLIRIERICSENSYTNRDKALNDALNQAQAKIMQQLRLLEPPVMTRPSLAQIRHDFVKRNEEKKPTEAEKTGWKAGGLDPNRVWVEIDVELTEAQVQKLRAGDRVSDGIRGAGVILALVAAAYGFLRLDAWTKGYLTLWLALAAIAAVVIATVLLA